MNKCQLTGLLLFSGIAAVAQNMPADYDGVLKTLGK